MFCSTCLSIFSSSLAVTRNNKSIFTHGPHHNHISGLQRSAAQKCRICKAIWLECIVGYGKEDWSDAAVSTRFKLVHDSECLKDAIEKCLEMQLIIRVERSIGNDDLVRDIVFDIMPYDSRNYCTSGDEVRMNPGQRLLGWYRNCLEHHDDCRPTLGNTYVPTRLLDIGLPASLEPAKLVQGAGKFGREVPIYATLSHCWGKSQPLRLLTENIQNMEQGIDREALPPLFSDVIDVCWHLGIRYLWIDCLCICQDSEEDWAKESKLMGKVYSHAIINIAATGSANSEGSMFHTAEEIPSAGVISSKGMAKTHVIVENNIVWGKSFLDQPLLRRAWVVQERLLAIRLIHFAQTELIWECRTMAASESYPIKMPDALMSFHERRNRFWTKDFAEDDGAWAVLIQDYSKCELTFSKDKLIALSGLVSALEERGLARGKYWVGMWEADLPYCLLWTRAAIDPSKWPKAHSNDYRAPSWSWASLDYPIWTEWASGTAESPIVSRWEVNETPGPRATAPLLSHRPLSLQMVGPLVRAEIKTKRPWVEAFGRGIERVHGISYCISEISVQGSSIGLWDDEWNDVIFDNLDQVNMARFVWCAPIYECEKGTGDADGEMRLFGLLLEEISTVTFRRVGVFSIGHRPDQITLKRLSHREYSVL